MAGCAASSGPRVAPSSTPQLVVRGFNRVTTGKLIGAQYKLDDDVVAGFGSRSLCGMSAPDQTSWRMGVTPGVHLLQVQFDYGPFECVPFVEYRAVTMRASRAV